MNDGMNLLRVGNQDKRRLETQHVSSPTESTTGHLVSFFLNNYLLRVLRLRLGNENDDIGWPPPHISRTRTNGGSSRVELPVSVFFSL